MDVKSCLFSRERGPKFELCYSHPRWTLKQPPLASSSSLTAGEMKDCCGSTHDFTEQGQLGSTDGEVRERKISAPL